VLAFAAWLYGRAPGTDEPALPWVRPGLIITANLLALAALSLEVLGYYDRLLTATAPDGSSTAIVRLLSSVALEGSSTASVREFQEGRIFALALIWTLYATGAFLVGAWRRSKGWRWGGLLLLMLTTPLLLANLLYYDAAWHALVFNRTLAAFALFVAALWLIARIYGRSGADFEEALDMRPVVIVAGNLLAIVALSAQAAGYYEAKIAAEITRETALGSPGYAERLRNLELAKQLSLSVVWGLYASGMLVAGQLRRLRVLRMMGLALLSLTTLKVFIWDLSSLDRVYRIISFIMLGAILLVVSYFYQRSQQRAEEEKPEVRDQESEVSSQ
jgi:hypothetical protein